MLVELVKLAFVAGGLSFALFFAHKPKKEKLASPAVCSSPVAKQPAIAWISPHAANAHLNHPDYLFLDARSFDRFREGHIPGAALYKKEDIAQLPAGKNLVVYGHLQSNCRDARDVAEEIATLVNAKVSVLEGGFEAWLSQGLPAQSGAGK